MRPKTGSIQQFVMSAVPFGVAMGIYFSFTKGLQAGMVSGAVSGIAFGGILLFVGKAVQSKMGSQADHTWESGEHVDTEGLANHFQGIISNGGMLFLSNRRLRFCGHKVNISVYDRSWKLDEIASVEAANAAWVIPNGIRIRLRNGESHRFVVQSRDEWIVAIREALVKSGG